MAEIDVCSPHEAIRKRAINGWLQSARTRHSLARSDALESGHSNVDEPVRDNVCWCGFTVFEIVRNERAM